MLRVSLGPLKACQPAQLHSCRKRQRREGQRRDFGCPIDGIGCVAASVFGELQARHVKVVPPYAHVDVVVSARPRIKRAWASVAALVKPLYPILVPAQSMFVVRMSAAQSKRCWPPRQFLSCPFLDLLCKHALDPRVLVVACEKV